MEEEKFPEGWIVVDHIIPGVTDGNDRLVVG